MRTRDKDYLYPVWLATSVRGLNTKHYQNILHARFWKLRIICYSKTNLELNTGKLIYS